MLCSNRLTWKREITDLHFSLNKLSSKYNLCALSHWSLIVLLCANEHIYLYRLADLLVGRMKMILIVMTAACIICTLVVLLYFEGYISMSLSKSPQISMSLSKLLYFNTSHHRISFCTWACSLSYCILACHCVLKLH